MKRIIFSLWFIVYGLLPFVYAQEEELTLLTYYPAPYGMYMRIGIGADIQFDDAWESRTLLKIQDNTQLLSAGTALLAVGGTIESQNSAIFGFQPGIAGENAFGIKTRIISRADAGATGPISALYGYAGGSNISGDITGVYGYGINTIADATTNCYGGNFTARHNTTAAGRSYGVYASSENSGAGEAIGVYSTVQQFGTGIHYGIFSNTESINSASNTYGIFNQTNALNNNNGQVLGIYNSTQINPGTGEMWGIYSTLSAGGQDGDGGEKVGAYFNSTVTAPDDSSLKGIENVAIISAGGGDGNIYGIRNTATTGGLGAVYGISSTASSTVADAGTKPIYGAYIDSNITNSLNGASVYGLYSDADTDGAGSVTGTYSIAAGPGSGAKYGVYASASGGSGTKYGIYSTVSGSGTRWAGYFNGRVKVVSFVEAGTTVDRLGSNAIANIYDVAELIPCAGDVGAGDVVVINPDKDREVEKCTKEDQITAGVISGDPLLSLGDKEKSREMEPEKNWNFLALAGQVYCKVDASYSEIRRGDLLTTSPTPGHAMKAVNPKIGTIVGKALEPLKEGKGKILVLVSLM